MGNPITPGSLKMASTSASDCSPDVCCNRGPHRSIRSVYFWISLASVSMGLGGNMGIPIIVCAVPGGGIRGYDDDVECIPEGDGYPNINEDGGVCIPGGGGCT